MFKLALRCLWVIAWVITTIALPVWTAADTFGAQIDESEMSRQVDDYLARVEADRGLDAAVIVMKDGEILVRKGYGIADDAAGSVFTPETAVGIASISKQFAAAAILRLVDQGKLSVEDRLGGLLPDVPADKAVVTIHQLLTHTAGLQSDHMESDLEPLSREVALDRILSAPLLSEPGEKYSYSNSGYTLLAAIVEEVSGQDYHEFLRGEFFDVLGMDRTGNWDDDRFDHYPVSIGYINGESSGPLNELPGPYWTVYGNGDIVSVVDDMLTWYLALSGGEVLSAESTDALFTSYTTSDGSDIQYGYGWEVSRREGLGRLIAHNGGGLTGSSMLSDYPDQGLRIIILSNRITYRTLGPIPLTVQLPADETSEALAKSIVSADFGTMPATTFVIWPYLCFLLLAMGLAVGVVLIWLKRHSRRQLFH